jgi:hypothetical protein
MNWEALKDKWGPLPVWGWGVLGGLALLVGLYFFNRERSLKSNVGVVDQDTYSGADAALGTVATNSSVIPTDIETNQTWLTKAVRYLSDQGYNSAEAMVWLQSLLSGIPVIGSEGKAAVREAIDRFGVPPDLSYGVPSFAPEVTTATPTQKGYYAKHPNGGTVWIVETTDASGNVGAPLLIGRQATANSWASRIGAFTQISYDQYLAKKGGTENV